MAKSRARESQGVRASARLQARRRGAMDDGSNLPASSNQEMDDGSNLPASSTQEMDDGSNLQASSNQEMDDGSNLPATSNQEMDDGSNLQASRNQDQNQKLFKLQGIKGKITKSSTLQASREKMVRYCDSLYIRIMETQADDEDHLVNNDNHNDDIGYESEEYSDDEADGKNNSDRTVVKRGITRLSKFRNEYGKPGGTKLSVTFDAMHRISGPNRALFSSFLGDLVREHIGLKILSWKKVGSEARDKLWDEITRHFDVDETVRKLVMHRLGGLLRNFRMKLRQTYILPNQKTPSKLNEVPSKYSAIVKDSEWVEFVQYTKTKEYHVFISHLYLSPYIFHNFVFASKRLLILCCKGKSAATKMARSKSVYQHTMGRGGYIHVKENMELKCRLCHLKRTSIIALGTVYVSDGKQMLHNKLLLNDCYKVSIDKSLVDAACIPDIGKNGFKTVKDAVGGFFAWPKNQVIIDEKVTPPTSIQKVIGENKTAPKLQTKRKATYVSSATVQKQAKANLKSQKSLNLGLLNL